MHWSRNSSAATGENHKEALVPLQHMDVHCGEDTSTVALELVAGRSSACGAPTQEWSVPEGLRSPQKICAGVSCER